MTQSIVQGSEDPLLVLDHQGGSGNPTFLIQQDENAAAYIWWDQVNQVFNMGPASAGGPSLSIASNGSVSMGTATINQLTVGDVSVKGGGIAVDHNVLAGTATINQLTVGDVSVKGGGIVVDNNVLALTATINQLTVGNVSVSGWIVVDQDMKVGGTITAGNYLTSSSREIKENTVDFSSQEALEVLKHLSPVKFNYKADDAKKPHIGFIAEDVPRSVASPDGKGISLTDIVAVLTRAVKEQQKEINTLSEKCHSLELAMNRARR